MPTEIAAGQRSSYSGPPVTQATATRRRPRRPGSRCAGTSPGWRSGTRAPGRAGARHDDALHPVRAAEVGRSARHVAVGQLLPDQAGGNLDAAVGQQRHALGGEVVLLAQLGQQRTSPGGAVPEAEVLPDHHEGRVQPVHQHRADELLGPSCENSRVNGIMQTTSAPSPASSSARRRTVHSNGGCEPGRITSAGCGSNVTTTRGCPSPRPASAARPMMRWWPRCTPSKTPMVTTDRPQSAGTSARPCHRYTALPSFRTPGGARGPLSVLPSPKPAMPPGRLVRVAGAVKGTNTASGRPAAPLVDQRDQGAIGCQRGHRAAGARRVQAGTVRQRPCDLGPVPSAAGPGRRPPPPPPAG